MRVAAARTAHARRDSRGAAESVLGTSTTAAAYAPHVRVDALSPTLAGCVFFNNPAIFAEGDRLYIVAECLEFDGSAISDARSRMVVLRTRPVGAPSGWAWEYVGVLADRALALEMGGERLTSADDLARRRRRAARSWRRHAPAPPASWAPAASRSSWHRSTRRRCAAAPAAAWSCVHARPLTADAGWHTGACTHDARSATGILTVAATTSNGLQAELLSTGLKP